MGAETQQIVVELISDTSQLQPAEDKLANLGKIDQQSAAIFKATNDQLKQRNQLLNEGVAANTDSASSAQKQQQIYDKLANSVKNLSGQAKQTVSQLLMLSNGNVAKYFDDAGTSVDDYIKLLESLGGQNDNVNKKSQSLRAELKQMTDQLGRLAADGKSNTEEFTNLSIAAGKLKNVIDDTRQTVAGLGQDVPKIQVFGAALNAITSGFTAAAGAQALFGDENQDLQAVLVKVNSVMAINAGLTQLIQTVNDEALVSTAKAIVAQTVRNAQIAIENGLQAESVVVRTAATVAQYALNLAMSLNPIAILTVGIAAFITGIVLYTQRTIAATKATTELGSAIANATELLDAYIAGNQRQNQVYISGLQARNARQSELDAQNLTSLKQIQAQQLQAYADLQKKVTQYQTSGNADVVEKTKEGNEALKKLEQQAADTQVEIIKQTNEQAKQLAVEALEDQAALLQGRLSLSTKNSTQQFALQRQLAAAQSAIDIKAAGDDAQKIFAIRSALSRQLQDIDIAENKAREDNLEAGLQDTLTKIQTASQQINDRTTQQEIDAQKKLIQAQADFAITQEGLTQKEKAAIQSKALQDQLALQRNFDVQVTQEVLADEISRNNKVLSSLKTSDADRLALQIANITDEAASEIAANQGKNDKIKEIEAKRDADIRAARLQSIQDELNYELELQATADAGQLRQLEKTLDQQAQLRNAGDYYSEKQLQQRLGIQKLDLNSQLAIIDQITQKTLDSDEKKKQALDDELDQGLISLKQYNLEYGKLQDDQAVAVEAGEKRKQDLIAQTAAKAKAQQQQLIDFVGQQATAAVNVLQTLYQQQDQAAEASIQAQRDNIQKLSDAGDISAKEAAARNLKLDVQEKQLQRQQAERDKEIALFNAIITGAQATLAALFRGGPIYAAVVGAIAAAEIAAIASRPIPSFGTGKKGNYSGPAEVGETGPEIIKRGNRMEYVDKSTITWLGPSDKVYNPKETTDMLERMVPNNYYPGSAEAKPSTFGIDYEKMGRAIGKNIPQTGIGFDEQGLYQWTQTQQSFKKMLAHRRRWKK